MLPSLNASFGKEAKRVNPGQGFLEYWEGIQVVRFQSGKKDKIRKNKTKNETEEMWRMVVVEQD